VAGSVRETPTVAGETSARITSVSLGLTHVIDAYKQYRIILLIDQQAYKWYDCGHRIGRGTGLSYQIKLNGYFF